MLRIAIVEDDKAVQDGLKAHLERFRQEEGVSFQADCFPDAVAFLSGYKPAYDAVFLDVEMPYMLGTDAAVKLREADRSVALVFITNMAQYAVKGYEVDAIDYILKPVSYYRFSVMLKKIVGRIRMQERVVDIRTPDGMKRIPENEIRAVCAEDHLLLYHTENGIIESWDTLNAVEQKLPSDAFFRINKSCIISLRHIDAIQDDTVLVHNRSFPISRRQKKAFLLALNRYLAR